MQFTWDERKNLINQQKHGISFETAVLVFDDILQVSRPERTVDGERRWQTIGMVNGIHVLLVAHTVSESGGKKGDEQKVELEVFLDGSPEEFAIIWGDGWSGLLEIPGFDLSDEWAEDKERDGTGDGGAGVVVDECTVGGGEDVIGVAEEALDVEGAGVGEGDGGEMLAHDVGRPEERVGDPAGEEHPPRCAHGGIIAWGNERSNPATYDGGSWDGSGVFA